MSTTVEKREAVDRLVARIGAVLLRQHGAGELMLRDVIAAVMDEMRALPLDFILERVEDLMGRAAERDDYDDPGARARGLISWASAVALVDAVDEFWGTADFAPGQHKGQETLAKRVQRLRGTLAPAKGEDK